MEYKCFEKNINYNQVNVLFFLSFFLIGSDLLVQGVYVLGGICPGGKCPGCKCPGGICPGVSVQEGICPGVSVRGVSVRGVYVLEPSKLRLQLPRNWRYCCKKRHFKGFGSLSKS